MTGEKQLKIKSEKFKVRSSPKVESRKVDGSVFVPAELRRDREKLKIKSVAIQDFGRAHIASKGFRWTFWMGVFEWMDMGESKKLKMKS